MASSHGEDVEDRSRETEPLMSGASSGRRRQSLMEQKRTRDDHRRDTPSLFYPDGDPEAAGPAVRGTATLRVRWQSAVRVVMNGAWFAERLHGDKVDHELEAQYRRAAPTARKLVVLQMLYSICCVGYTASAWVYCCIARRSLFIRCPELYPVDILDVSHKNWYALHGCEASQLFFWTFPLGCCLACIIFYWLDACHVRVWYEMLAHHVIMDFENTHFLKSIKMIVVWIWGVAALSMFVFAKRLTWDGLMMSLPYWFPVLSFFVTMYTAWDIEARLMSVATYTSSDPEWAKAHHGRCESYKDFVLREAFNRVHERVQHEMRSGALLADGTHLVVSVKQFTTAGFVDAIHEEAKRVIKDGLTTAEACADSAGVFGWNYHGWMFKLLYTECLQDDTRAMTARFWMRIYAVYSISLLSLVSYLLFTTIVTHLRQQRVIPDTWWVGWFSVDNFVSFQT